jgi:hypothetical protein
VCGFNSKCGKLTSFIYLFSKIKTMLKVDKSSECKKYRLTIEKYSDDYDIDLIQQYRSIYIKNESANATHKYGIRGINPYDCFCYRMTSDFSQYNRRCNEWAIQQLNCFQKKKSLVYTSYVSDNSLLQDVIILDSFPDNIDYHVNLIVSSHELLALLSSDSYISSTEDSSQIIHKYIKFLEYFTTTKNNFELHIYAGLSSYVDDCIINKCSRCDLFLAIDYNDKQKRVYQHLLLTGMLCLVPKGIILISSVQVPFNVFCLNDNVNRQSLCNEVKQLTHDVKQYNEEIKLGTYETKELQEGKYLDTILLNSKQYLFADKYLSKEGKDYFITTVYKTTRCTDVQALKDQRLNDFYLTTVVKSSYKYLTPVTWTWLLLKYYSFKTFKYLYIL